MICDCGTRMVLQTPELNPMYDYYVCPNCGALVDYEMPNKQDNEEE